MTKRSGRDRAIDWARSMLDGTPEIRGGNFVVLDTETTGLNRERDDEPVAIALVAPSGAVLLDTLINPHMAIDPDATAVHGISDDMVKDAPGWWDIRSDLFDAIRGKTVVTYNAAFDLSILRNADARHGKNFVPGISNVPKNWSCAMEQYAAFYGDWDDYRQDYRWVKLTRACEQQGVVVKLQAHSALGDCLRTLGLVRAMADAEIDEARP